MELADNRLIVTTPLIHSIIDLRAIEKIVGTEEYTFVYIASTQAFVIPMNRYPEDEYRAFVAELREAWENIDATLPPGQDLLAKRPMDDRFRKSRDP
jgi:hypothetical protein